MEKQRKNSWRADYTECSSFYTLSLGQKMTKPEKYAFEVQGMFFENDIYGSTVMSIQYT